MTANIDYNYETLGHGVAEINEWLSTVNGEREGEVTTVAAARGRYLHRRAAGDHRKLTYAAGRSWEHQRATMAHRVAARRWARVARGRGRDGSVVDAIERALQASEEAQLRSTLLLDARRPIE